MDAISCGSFFGKSVALKSRTVGIPLVPGLMGEPLSSFALTGMRVVANTRFPMLAGGNQAGISLRAGGLLSQSDGQYARGT